MAAGKQLLQDRIMRPLRVVLINLEDNRSTMDKRIAAAMRHYKLKPSQIGDRLTVIAKGEIKFKIAKRLPNGEVERNEQVMKALTELMKEKKADVLSIDSFVRTHKVRENENSEIEQVIECYEEISLKAECAVHAPQPQVRRRKGDRGIITRRASLHRCLPLGPHPR